MANRPIDELTGTTNPLDLLTKAGGDSLYVGKGRAATDLQTGSVDPSKLALPADASTYLRGDGTWASIAGGGDTVSQATRPAMAGTASTTTKVVYLREEGREGLFVWSGSNHSADVTSDPQQGVYVAPTSDTTGASGAWVRKDSEPLNVHWFGAKGDGVTDDTLALQAVSALVVARGGGTIVFESKTYLVGTQQPFAGVTGLGYAYSPPGTGAISITGCSKPVVIDGRGAKLVYPNGYKFGSFDPVTGVRYDPTLPFNNVDYRGKMLDGMIRLENNTGRVTVSNFELDGNMNNAVLGGQYNDVGRQIPGTGVWAYGNADYELHNIKSHDHPLDGWIQGWTGLTIAMGRQTALAVGCDFIGNARQGLSWVGGNGLVAIDCKFNQTGRGAFESAPGAGVDIEAEASICRNGHFISCEFTDNTGSGLTADQGDSSDVRFTHCSFIGTTNFSCWPRMPRYAFDGCTFVGCVVNAYSSADPKLATKFYNCLFSADTSRSPTGQVYLYGSQILNLGGGDQNVLFDGCTLDTGGNTAALPIYTNGQAIFRNVTIKQDNVTAGNFSYPRGFWHGVNTVDGLSDFNGTHLTQNYGHLVYNGTAFDYSPPFDSMTPPSGMATIHGQVTVDSNVFVGSDLFATDLQIGKSDYSNGTIVNYYRTGGAYVLDEAFIKKNDGTVVQVSQTTSVGPDYDSIGYRIAGVGGCNIGSMVTYNLMAVADSGIWLRGALTFDTSGVLQAAATPAFSGDITKAAGSLVTTIGANKVTYAKVQQVAASRLLGNPTGALANAQEISLAGGLAFSGTTLTAAGALTPTSVVSTGAITSSSATSGVGYSTGAGGTVTQLTSRTTGVILNKPCGTITLLSAAGSATWSTFTVTNSTVAATDTVEVVQASGANLYNVIVTKVVAGSFNVSVSAVSGTATEAPTFNFVVTKSVTA